MDWDHSRDTIDGSTFYLLIKERFYITVEVFKLEKKYTVFTYSSLPGHEKLVGVGEGKTRNIAMNIAIQKLYKRMGKEKPY
jgi:hypothetical protein